MKKAAKIEVKGTMIAICSENDMDFISLTDMLRAKDGDFFISDWLRNRNTVEFLGIWEQVHNPDFNYGEFAAIKSQAGLNSYKLSVKEWVEKTNAIGLTAMKQSPILRALFALLASWLLASPCLAQNEPDFPAVSDTLFPESRSWPLFTDYPALTAAEFENLKAPLAQAFRSQDAQQFSSVEVVLKSAECEFIERTFKAENLAAFRRIDWNQDGFLDVVYSGSRHCSEGVVTIVWFGSAEGYTMKGLVMSERLLLRVSPDGKKTVSVEPGCCASRVDNYYMNGVSIDSRDDDMVILKETVLSERRYDQARTFSTRYPVRLRSSPKISDGFDMGQSVFLGHAAFGNVVRVYLAGAGGRGLGETEEKSDGKNGEKKQRWLFVVVDWKSDWLVLQDPYREGYKGIRAGWLRADQVSVPAK
ncbi:MAG: KilA-N domain-containing protein [Burkholderiales bacterium]|nr:KilA-N domain-containing protein [Burkholderiales bacterium]